MSNGNKKVFEGPLEIVSAEGIIAGDGIQVHLAYPTNKEQFWEVIFWKAASYTPQ